jgi:hypothetical protein
MRETCTASIDGSISEPYMMVSLMEAVSNPEALLEPGVNHAVLRTMPDGLFVAQTSGHTFEKGLFHRMHEYHGRKWW